MRTRSIVLSLLMGLVLMATAQPVAGDVEWYLDEVVSDVFVKHNDFEYYYVPSAADMAQQREKGEVSYFLNTPGGLNRKKTCDLIDRLMASYDDIKAQGDWHMTSTTYWKEFRHERNRFRFSVKRKALDDGTYYVSITETANYYKSLGKKGKQSGSQVKQKSAASPDKRSTRRDRKPVVEPDDDETAAGIDDEEIVPFVSEKQRRQEAREKKEAQRREERARQRREQDKRREEAKVQREAEKQKKAEEKKQKEEEKRLKKEEERRMREQARREREQARREQAEARKEASRKASAAPKPVESRFHYTDVALWLSEKYDFTQIAAGDASCTMYSTAVKDVEMAKLAIKNALKGSNARMAVPWRVNSETQAIETGYTVDGHVLVFAIGKDDDGNTTVTVTEVSGDEFELFKQGLGN